MSEFTFGFLVNNSVQNHQIIKDTVDNVLIKELNEDWIVFILDDFDVPQSILDLSTKCPVMNFHNAEDHNWGFSIYHNEKEVSVLDVSYELEDTITSREIELRYPEIDDYIEFMYIDPIGKKVLEAMIHI